MVRGQRPRPCSSARALSSRLVTRRGGRAELSCSGAGAAALHADGPPRVHAAKAPIGQIAIRVGRTGAGGTATRRSVDIAVSTGADLIRGTGVPAVAAVQGIRGEARRRLAAGAPAEIASRRTH